MAFPGTYNFSYYRGDTLEFKIYPKTTSGSPFSLEDYNVSFSIATQRGLPANQQINAYATVSNDNSFVTCVITPSDGALLTAGTPYVYDVEIRNLSSADYPKVYTLLTGDISVVEQITNVELSVPDTPTNLVITESPAGTVNVSWDAPATGDAAESYNIYGKADSLGATTYTLLTNTANTTYSANSIFGFPFQSGVQYDIKVTAVNAAGENNIDFVEGSVTIA